MLTGVDPPLDGAVVLLVHIIQIWHRPVPTILGQTAFAFELRNGGRIRGVAIGVDHPRREMVRSTQRFCEKALSRGCVLSCWPRASARVWSRCPPGISSSTNRESIGTASYRQMLSPESRSSRARHWDGIATWVGRAA